MKFSSDLMCSLFLQAQALVVTPEKGGKNNHLHNEYSTLRDINNAIRHANSAVGIKVVQEVIFDPANVNPNIMLMQTTLIYIERIEKDKVEKDDESALNYQAEQVIHTAVNVMPVPIGKMDAQGFGSTFTYARRYALDGIYNLSSADDDGNGATLAIEKTVDMWKADIKDAKTIDDLNAIMVSAKGQRNKGLVKAIQPAANDRKREINMNNAKSFNPASPANATINEPSVQRTEIDHADDDEEF